MYIETIPAGMLAANCYIVGCKDTKEGVIVDPGGDALNILSKINALGLDIKYIILTHGHLDHIGAVNDIKKRTQAQICIHEEDRDMLINPALNFSKQSGREIIVGPPDVELKDGDELWVGNIALKIIHTPGHSLGGICIYTNNSVFTGDTLFASSIGRTDFYGGSMEEILYSIKTKLFTLPEETRVYPGHGPSSTIGIEKKTNPFFV